MTEKKHEETQASKPQTVLRGQILKARQILKGSSFP